MSPTMGSSSSPDRSRSIESSRAPNSGPTCFVRKQARFVERKRVREVGHGHAMPQAGAASSSWANAVAREQLRWAGCQPVADTECLAGACRRQASSDPRPSLLRWNGSSSERTIGEVDGPPERSCRCSCRARRTPSRLVPPTKIVASITDSHPLGDWAPSAQRSRSAPAATNAINARPRPSPLISLSGAVEPDVKFWTPAESPHGR